MKIALVLSVFLFIIFALIIYRSIQNAGDTNFNLLPGGVQPSLSSNPTPFEGLTIPYLRNRDYSSALGILEQTSQTSNYISFLTNYQSDGLRINGLLTKPNSEMPIGGWPAVIFIHGYIPPNEYQTHGSAYSSYVDYLARNGFVVFKIDLRGHGDSEGTPGGAYYSSDYVIDTLNAYAALASSDFVNPKRIGLWGHSMAGNVTLRSFVVKQDIPALVIWAGAGFTYRDLAEYRISDSSYRPQSSSVNTQSYRQRLRDLYGDPSGANPFWLLVAPTNYLDSVGGAIQLHHAVDDETVNVEYSRNLNQILDNTTVPHEYHEYQRGGHDIEGDSFINAMNRTVSFFQKHLNSNQ